MEVFREINNTELCSRVGWCKPWGHFFHWHTNFEICQLVKGSCNFVVEGNLIEAQEGDIIAINERAIHRFLVENDDVYVRVIQFPLKILLRIIPAINPIKTHISAKEIRDVPGLQNKMEAILLLMDQEDSVSCAENNPFLQTLTASFYFLLMRNFSAGEYDKNSQKEQQEFYRIIEYVNEHYFEKINVSVLAKKLYITRGKLANIFSKYAGTSIKEYINTLRIRNVNQMLMDGYDIATAALESGFQSIRTFNNAYKTNMGITPTEYLKKLQKKEKEEGE